MNQAELLQYTLQGHEEAIKLINDLSTVSQLWDDLIDRDKPVSNNEINKAFILLLSDLPRNSFYAKYQLELLPLTEAAILDWLTANTFEDDPEYHAAASVLRDNLALVIIGSAKIIGGMEWAEKVSVDIRRHIHDESLEDYQNGFNERSKS